MKSIQLKIILRRFVELFLTCETLSFVLNILSEEEILTGELYSLLGTLAGTVIFTAVNFSMMRQCYFDLKDKHVYYFSNIAAYLIFAAFGFAVFFANIPEVYAAMFKLASFAKYTGL